ncbi:type I secretion system permease/ATPase [Chelatococcus asaccharovorans]|uniref:type I secretion system permease/ATPase n=1 Tax=Chelatococcus asaccharovorans TaxID=28210 RepID=UPI00224C6D29|nr:type I secretion system permease/ATPase [Chelatococcus asaccharovorans]CAH1671283.1 Leukotoxin export ATP-binding protein LtxB [Chelatococcus asaccharovorans]CAH1677299.1 Leukotoxin export ATP-binding protein LtxB [Chelatococcus asaccharovorans]
MADRLSDTEPADANSPDESGLLCFALVLRFLGISVGVEQLRHNLGLPSGQLKPADLLRLSRRIGLKARWVSASPSRLDRLPLPAVAQARDGDYFIIAKYIDDRALVYEPRQRGNSLIDAETFGKRWNGRILLLARRGGAGVADRHFGFGWFLQAVGKYRRVLAEVLVCSFFLQVFGLLTPLFFQVVIDKVLVHESLSTLDVLVIGLAGMALFEILLGGLRTYLFSHTTSRIDVELGARLFEHLAALPLAYFEARHVGDSVARVRELENIRAFLTGSALTLAMDLVFTSLFFVVMYVYSPLLTLIVAGSVPLYAILSLVVTPLFRRRLEEKFNRSAENQSFLVETVSGIETVKATAIEKLMQRRWEDQIAGYAAASFRVARLANWSGQIARAINKLTVILILYGGARIVLAHEMTVGELVAFNMLAGQVHGPVLRLAQMWQDFQQVRISVARLGDILNARAEPTYAVGHTTPAIVGQISFQYASFRYDPTGPEILSDISVDIPAGQIVGIVGASGSGKSTLAKLIQRLYVPERGRVLIDGMDLSLMDPSWLRRQLGVVLQENMLFTGTVRENIAIADPGLPIETVVEAAQLAGAHDFIAKLPLGYDTILAERGASLSGGQRQRIAIARALIMKPAILIFDEATSALDYESERVIQDNMKAMAKGRTAIIIAHRLSAVQMADRILTIEDGRLVEDGTPAELATRGGRFASLLQYQQGQRTMP